MKPVDRARNLAASKPSAAHSGNLRWSVVLLVVAVAAAYSNTLHGPFVFDDKPSIVENESIRHLGSLQVLAPSPDAVTTTGRPLVNLSLALNYAVGGLEVEGYHVVNLAIHILAALALFGLFRRTFLLPALAQRMGAASTGLALTIALLWAVHPLQTESVTYVVQRAEAMVGLFYILTLYFVVCSATAAHAGRWSAAAVGACAAGMGSKEVMVSAPLVALLYHGFFVSGSLKESLRRRWRWWLALAATWAILAVLVLESRHRGGSAGFGLGMTAWQYARRQFGCIIDYLRLSLWPSPLVLDYGNAAVKDTSNLLLSAIGVLSLVTATVAMLVVRPTWGFLGLCFFAILAPTSSFVPLPGQVEAEHRMYLPLAAVVAAIVLAAHRMLTRLGGRLRHAAMALVSVVALALSWGTYRRNQVYQSELVLWDTNIRNGPLNYRAYHNRGNAYLAKGEVQLAIEDFATVVRLNPRDPKVYVDRANALSAAGRYDAAFDDYDRAIRMKPDFADAYNGRGSAYGNKGAVDAAFRDFDMAIKLDPLHAEAYFNRANTYDTKGQFPASIADYTQAIALRPDYADAYIGRGNAYQAQGQYASAVRDYDKAISLRPDFAGAYRNRAIAHTQVGAYAKARADLKKFQILGGTPDPELVQALNRAPGRGE